MNLIIVKTSFHGYYLRFVDYDNNNNKTVFCFVCNTFASSPFVSSQASATEKYKITMRIGFGRRSEIVVVGPL